MTTPASDRHELLTADLVEPRLRGRFGRPYRWSEECASTQDVLRAAGLPEGAVAVTEHQTGGRGRSGRSWEDAPGRSLLLSILLRPERPAAQLSLVVGLAVAEAIDATAGTQAMLKWPNDVLLGDRKVAGILLETVGSAVICGVGVNVNQSGSELPAATRLGAASLRLTTGRTHDRAMLLAGLLVALERRYDEWRDDDLWPLLPELDRRDALRGRQVNVSGVSGVAAGIAADGRLQITRDDGTVERVASGEVQEPLSD